MTDAVTEKNQKTVTDYLGDMKAIETHIEEALDQQLDMFDDLPDVQKAVRGYHDMVRAQRDHLEELLKSEPNGSVTNSVKDAGTSLLGKAAGLIDKVRTESQSKALRDDYVAFNVAAIGYGMLYTTATALGNNAVASVAEKHLTGYADAIQEINHLVPEVVVHELQKDDHQIIRTDVVAQSRAIIDRAWKVTGD